MKTMSTDYLESGPTRQKQRTRDQLIAAARELITAATRPASRRSPKLPGTLAQPPTATSRHGPNFSPRHSRRQEPRRSFRPAAGSAGRTRGRRCRVLIGLVQENEPQQRAMLRLSLARSPTSCPCARAASFRGSSRRSRLSPTGSATRGSPARAGSPAACGMETRVWLSDIAGLAPTEVSVLQRWMVDALVKQALETPPP